MFTVVITIAEYNFLRRLERSASYHLEVRWTRKDIIQRISSKMVANQLDLSHLVTIYWKGEMFHFVFYVVFSVERNYSSLF